jgi:tRNA-guanine family transglycosylase
VPADVHEHAGNHDAAAIGGRDRQQELLGLRLLTVHNLRFLIRLTAGARAAMADGKLATFKAETLDRLTLEAA